MADGCHRKRLDLLPVVELGLRVEAVLGVESRRLNELYGEVVLEGMPTYELATELKRMIGSLSSCMAFVNEFCRRQRDVSSVISLTARRSAPSSERTLSSVES